METCFRCSLLFYPLFSSGILLVSNFIQTPTNIANCPLPSCAVTLAVCCMCCWAMRTRFIEHHTYAFPASITGTTSSIISIFTVGATLSAANAPTSLHLLPGTYTSTTNPQLLHRLLTSAGASLSPFPGFENVSQAFTSSSSLPLDLAMSPGLTTYAGVRYSGQASYTGFQEPSSSSDIAQGEASSSLSPTQMTASSLTLSDDVYMIVGGSSNASDRVVLWDSVPDVTQLPLTSSLVSSSSGSVINLNLISLYSTTCNPTCSSNGVCSPLNNTCLCAPGFTGSSCESCAPGFFGPTCQACPGGCDQCDEGIQGTGRCLKKTIVGKPEDCGCVNGQCGNNGQCVCNAGWQDAPAGEKCAKCQDGFFLTSTGDCQGSFHLVLSSFVDTNGWCFTPPVFYYFIIIIQFVKLGVRSVQIPLGRVSSANKDSPLTRRITPNVILSRSRPRRVRHVHLKASVTVIIALFVRALVGRVMGLPPTIACCARLEGICSTGTAWVRMEMGFVKVQLV